MILKDNNKDYKIEIYTSALMIMIASADEHVDDNEISTIKDIITDFYDTDMEMAENILIDAYKVIEESTDIYQIGSFLNEKLSKQDKIDLICCIFEVAYSDKNLHFMEKHLVDKISNIFNLNRSELLKAKQDIEKYL